jgi:hypothetical protein
MDITAIASAVSSNASTQLQSQASLLVLKKAMEMQQAQAALLLQALPQPTGPTPGAVVGGNVDTFA